MLDLEKIWVASYCLLTDRCEVVTAEEMVDINTTAMVVGGADVCLPVAVCKTLREAYRARDEFTEAAHKYGIEPGVMVKRTGGRRA